MSSMSSRFDKGILVCLSALCVLVLYIARISVTDTRKFGEVAIECLYTYNDDFACTKQDSTLESICSPDVYAQLTLEKEGTLRTLIRTAREQTKVHIIKSANQYVIYSLETPQLDREQRYVLFFEVDDNIIIEARECELNDFIDFDESRY